MYHIILFFLISVNQVYSQTNSQIKQAKELIKNSGISIEKAKSIARSKGYTDDQINQVIEKNEKRSRSNDVNNLSEVESFIENEDQNTITDFNQESDEEENPENNIFSKKENIIKNSVPFFGYNIFKQDPELFQSSSKGVVDPNYLIGPNDEIILMMWGETQFRLVLSVDKEGFIFIPEIGQVFVNGLNLRLLESKLFKVLSQSYASLISQQGEAATFLDISLGKLRPLRIQVLGQVKQPGAYTVSSSTTLFSSLYYFNGPTIEGSLRDIRLIRGGKELSSIDYYDFLLTGKKPNDLNLQLDDIIFIPPRKNSIEIRGEINKPGTYELKKDETLEDLIELANGLKATAYLNRIQIDRVLSFSDRILQDMDRTLLDFDLNKIMKNNEKIKLFDGDKIEVFSILEERLNTVKILGSVSRPGKYDIGDSLNLKQLIEKADGLLGSAYLKRIDITRTYKDFSKELIKVNFDSLKESNYELIKILSMDEVKVYDINEMRNNKSVSIYGHVFNPGFYTLKKNMRLSDLIFYGGGFLDDQWKNSAYLGRADLIRFEDNMINKYIIPFNLGELLNNQNNKNNFLLNDGDRIQIYSQKTFNAIKPIRINGAVKNEGSYDLKNGMTIKDLILEAGGLIENVYRYKIEIARIDPNNSNEEVFAKIIQLDMFNDYSISNIEYDYKPSKKHININRKEFFLEPYDFVSVRPDPYFRMQQQVRISGAVYYPGVYTITNPEESISDILKRCGGMRQDAFVNGASFIRNDNEVKISIKSIIKKPKSGYDITLQNNDQIIIPRKSGTVELKGEVSAPGLYKYSKKMRVKDLIENAGGFTMDSNKKDIFIIFPNGISKKYKRIIRNYKVEEGSIVIVGRKEEREPFDVTEYAKDVSSILANFAQAISLIILAKG